MGRGRGKGKKHSGNAAGDNAGSGDDGKLTSRRRGRPQKLIKEDTKRDNEAVNIEEEEEEYNDNSEDMTGLISSKISKNLVAAENGRKRKVGSQTKESVESVVTDENSSGTKANALTGYRQNGHRRKNKPRRAAEAVVECL